MTTDQAIEEFVVACHRVAAMGLMRCSSGNLSLRLDDTRMLATRSRSWLERITSEEVAICKMEDDRSLNGITPTAEVAFHSGILRTRPDVNAVLHFQSPFATVMACIDTRKTNFFAIPEVPYYMGPVADIPYLPPGSRQLAEAVIAAMQDHKIGILQNHGQIALGDTLDDVVQNAAFFELACEVIYRAGERLRPLSPTAARDLLNHRGST